MAIFGFIFEGWYNPSGCILLSLCLGRELATIEPSRSAKIRISTYRREGFVIRIRRAIGHQRQKEAEMHRLLGATTAFCLTASV
jgi:hypothetical protein